MNKPGSHTEQQPKGLTRWVAPVVVVASVLLLLALFYVEENLRGEIAWRRTKAELERKGEILDWKHYLPNPPPHERNMMKVSGMAETFIKGRSGGLMIATTPPQRLSRSNYIRFGEIEMVGDAARAMISLEKLRTNATARRALTRHFTGVGVAAPPGFELTQRLPGAEVKRVLLASRTLIDTKEFQTNNGVLMLAADKVEQTGSNVFALLLQQGRCHGAEEYLEWSAGQSNVFAMVDEAGKRPDCWLPGDYSIPFSSPIANFVAVRTAAQLMGSRAQAFLLLDRPDEAYAELQRIDVLNRIVTAKPMTVVSAMIYVAITGLQISVVADGFAMGAWQERHWRGFIENYSTRQLLPQVVDALRSGERAGVLELIEQLSTDGGRRVIEQDPGLKSMADFFRVTPRGWAPLNAAYYARAVQKQIELLSEMPAIDPQGARRLNDEMIAQLEQSRSPTRMMARIAVINLNKAAQTMTRNQTGIEHLIIASALELQRKKNGQYPETIGELSSEFFKRDPSHVIRGKALRYERRKNGEYVLYSIGWNGKDDMAPLLANQDTPMFDIFESKTAADDWVWKGVPELKAK